MVKKEINFEIIEELLVLSESKSGWKKEVNIVRWNDGEPKLDIRSWNNDKSKMGKGITFNYDEAQLLKEYLSLNDINF